MLSPIRTPEGEAQTSEYICPVALCESGSEARNIKSAKLRFAPCPKKFAAAFNHDTNLANAALKDYVEQGSGKFRDHAEREAFANDVKKACRSKPNSSEGTRVVGSISKVESCDVGQMESVSKQYCDSVRLETQLIQEDKVGIRMNHGEREGVFNGCVIIETYNAQGVTKAPTLLTQNPLKLLVASKVEPPSRNDIQKFKRMEFERTVHRKFEEHTDGKDAGCWVLMEMAYGIKYTIPYKTFHGRILVDTGSTTTLIKESFAVRQGLDIRSTGTGEILLRDVNDGSNPLTKQCFLSLTLITVEGESISFTVLAFCVGRLKHDILHSTT
jgi:hypothetical protein